MGGTQDLTGGGGLRACGTDDIDAWLQRAQPLAQLCYHVGVYAADAGEEVCERLQAEEARGMLYLFQRRRRRTDGELGFGFDYLACRSSRPWAPGTAQPRRPAPSMAEQARGEAEQRIRRVFA